MENQLLITKNTAEFTIQTLLHDCPTQTKEEVSINKTLKFPKGLWLNKKVIIEDDVKIIDNRPYYRNMEIICHPAGMAQFGMVAASLIVGITHVLGSVIASPFLLYGLHKKKQLLKNNKKMQLYYSIIDKTLKVCKNNPCYLVTYLKKFMNQLEIHKQEKLDCETKKKELLNDNYPTEQVKSACMNEVDKLNLKIAICNKEIDYYNEQLLNYPLDDDSLKEMINEYNMM